jgi:hypothetical protein
MVGLFSVPLIPDANDEAAFELKSSVAAFQQAFSSVFSSFVLTTLVEKLRRSFLD